MTTTHTCNICGKVSQDKMKMPIEITMDICDGCWDKLPHQTHGMDINWERIARYYINNVGVRPDQLITQR